MVLKNERTLQRIAEDEKWREYGVAEIDVHRLITTVPKPVVSRNMKPPKWAVNVYKDHDPTYWKDDHVIVIASTNRVVDHIRDCAIVTRPPGPMRDPLDDDAIFGR